MGFDQDMGIHDGGIRPAAPAKTGTPSSSTPRKRLSGGTLNMRFMKQRKANSNNGSNSNDRSETPTADARRTNPSPPSDGRRMEVDDAGSNNNSDGSTNNADAHDDSKYEAATSVDMYGMEASLIGRRSFGGFNAPVERMLTEARDYLKNQDATTKSRTNVSDEELLRRYAESNGTRGVGNLDKKVHRKQRRGGKNNRLGA